MIISGIRRPKESEDCNYLEDGRSLQSLVIADTLQPLKKVQVIALIVSTHCLLISKFKYTCDLLN